MLIIYTFLYRYAFVLKSAGKLESMKECSNAFMFLLSLYIFSFVDKKHKRIEYHQYP